MEAREVTVDWFILGPKTRMKVNWVSSRHLLLVWLLTQVRRDFRHHLVHSYGVATFLLPPFLN